MHTWVGCCDCVVPQVTRLEAELAAAGDEDKERLQTELDKASC